MSPSFCLNGYFASFQNFLPHTRTGPITLPLRKRRVIRLLLAHRACASLVTAPGQTGLSYRACDVRRHHVSSCLCSAPHQQLVRATIGALALGFSPLGNSRTRSYHAMSVDLPPHVAGLHRENKPYARAHVSKLTFAPVDDHVMPKTSLHYHQAVCAYGMWRRRHHF